MNNFEIRGDLDNPYHFSVGAVIVKGSDIAIIYKQHRYYTLLRETLYITESISEGLIRGAQEELGVTINTDKFLGGLVTHFDRNGTTIEKTTVYFLCQYTGDTSKKREHDELDDTIYWVSPKKALDLLEQANSPEAEIIKRI